MSVRPRKKHPHHLLIGFLFLALAVFFCVCVFTLAIDLKILVINKKKTQ